MDWSWLGRWPLLVGALLGIGLGVWLLDGSDQPGAQEFAAFVLIVAGAVCLGAFIESRKE